MTPCVLWTGSRDKDGYGHAKRGSRNVRVHRWAYEAARGPIPEGKEIDHLCRTPPCFNPDHLEAVTRAEHARRSVKATKTRCVNGHAYDQANTYFNPRGNRDCRACFRDRTRRYQSRLASRGAA